jgi:hypothetical protein
MHQLFWRSYGLSASGDIPCPLWNSQFHCHLHRITSSLQTDTESDKYSLQISILFLFCPHYIFPSTPRSTQLLLFLLWFSHSRIFHCNYPRILSCPNHSYRCTLLAWLYRIVENFTCFGHSKLYFPFVLNVHTSFFNHLLVVLCILCAFSINILHQLLL